MTSKTLKQGSGLTDKLWWAQARPDDLSRYFLGVYDGDTLDVTVDDGFGATSRHRLRLLRVNTPELKRGSPEHRARGQAAKAFVLGWVEETMSDEADRWPLVIRTSKSDAFGRYLADVYRKVDGSCINDLLLETGHAVPFRG